MNDILTVSGLNKSYGDFSLKDVTFSLPETCKGFQLCNDVVSDDPWCSSVGSVIYDHAEIPYSGIYNFRYTAVYVYDEQFLRYCTDGTGRGG